MNNDNKENNKEVIKISLTDFIKLIISCILIVFLGIYLMFIFAYKEVNEVEIENTRKMLMENVIIIENTKD